MDAVLRAVAMYFVILVLIRISGSRSLSQMTPFDFVLLLIIAEGSQQALLGDDFSITTGAIVISTLVGIDIGLSVLKGRFRGLERVIDSAPVVLVVNGSPLMERLSQVRVDEEDILAAARMNQGLERMDQIKYAVLERNGALSIIPASGGG